MERTDWLDKGFDASDARFLMATAISHHRFRSPMWGEEEILKLYAEAAEIDRAAEQAIAGEQRGGATITEGQASGRWPLAGTT
jgi:hypothetical protein